MFPRIFNSPDEMEAIWIEYKSDLAEQAKEWLKVQYVGKNGERVSDPQKVPMTLEGFKRFCYNRVGGIHQYIVNKDELYTEYIDLVVLIKEEIRENQIIGGMLGFYNHNITARLNGLVDKSAIDLKTEQPLFPDAKKPD